jgi:molybdopterin converting factor subunit 1
MIAAIVPAAGLSQRMGRPKLLLPIGGESLIGRVVTALREGGADRVVVVAPPSNSEEGPAVAALASRAGAFVIAPQVRPAEMRDSFEVGLRALAGPTPPDHVLLAPGDAAGITRAIVARLLEESARQADRIIVPRFGPRRGHPLVLPWKFAQDVASLPSGKGVSAILARYQTLVVELELPDSGVADDIDTPDDLGRWQEGSLAPQSSVRVPVQFFALAKDRAGCSAIDLELPGGSRVADLRAELARRLPGLSPLMKNVMIAVNEEYADDDASIMPGARVAVIPPVSGGASGSARRAVSTQIRGSNSP